ncbi:50S ribosomal protein L24 [Patescibacteria group bacterium]|nr:50S ribosomal protein L24 [Patescibacteria group bacterium]
MKIKKNDNVQIIQGKDAGKKGKVLRSLPQVNKVVVEGLNLAVKHIRPRREGEKGQKVKIAMPIQVSNLMLICPRCKKPVRVGYKILADGTKQRFCRKCKDVFN